MHKKFLFFSYLIKYPGSLLMKNSQNLSKEYRACIFQFSWSFPDQLCGSNLLLCQRSSCHKRIRLRADILFTYHCIFLILSRSRSGYSSLLWWILPFSSLFSLSELNQLRCSRFPFLNILPSETFAALEELLFLTPPLETFALEGFTSSTFSVDFRIFM